MKVVQLLEAFYDLHKDGSNGVKDVIFACDTEVRRELPHPGLTSYNPQSGLFLCFTVSGLAFPGSPPRTSPDPAYRGSPGLRIAQHRLKASPKGGSCLGLMAVLVPFYP